METFPQKVIENIFYRLPAKAVGRSRCVSKPLRHFLSQPEFIKNHLKQTKIRPRDEESLILVNEYCNSLYTIQLNNTRILSGDLTTGAKKVLDFNDDCLPSIKITRIISCDGLVVVGNHEKWFLLNPTTRELKELPRSPYALTIFRICGLGYDSASDDYKVVGITYENEMVDKFEESFHTLYSVRNDTWKKIECSPHYISYEGDYFSAETINGCIHWIATQTEDSPFLIAAFDFKYERYREVPLPRSLDGCDLGNTHGLAILKGCLCIYRERSMNCEYDFWMMKRYGVKDSWTKFTIIDPEGTDALKLLCMLGKDKLFLLKDEDWDENKLVVYNLEDDSFMDVGDEGTRNAIYVEGTCTYIESLVSPHCSTEAIEECVHGIKVLQL